MKKKKRRIINMIIIQVVENAKSIGMENQKPDKETGFL